MCVIGQDIRPLLAKSPADISNRNILHHMHTCRTPWDAQTRRSNLGGEDPCMRWFTCFVSNILFHNFVYLVSLPLAKSIRLFHHSNSNLQEKCGNEQTTNCCLWWTISWHSGTTASFHQIGHTSLVKFNVCLRKDAIICSDATKFDYFHCSGYQQTTFCITDYPKDNDYNQVLLRRDIVSLILRQVNN